MEYVIKNHENVFIRLNENGRPVTCTKDMKFVFEYSKAKNILDSLPKTLKRLNFKVYAVPDIPTNSSKEKSIQEQLSNIQFIKKDNYIVPDSIMKWVEKFGVCDDILKEALKRKDELNKALSNVDKEFINLVHEIELEGRVDLYSGWKERNSLKENRERRRQIKDELRIISDVLNMDFRKIDRNVINKKVAELADRKFTYRIIEEEEINAV